MDVTPSLKDIKKIGWGSNDLVKISTNCAKLELATNEKVWTAISHETQDNQCQYASQ